MTDNNIGFYEFLGWLEMVDERREAIKKGKDSNEVFVSEVDETNYQGELPDSLEERRPRTSFDRRMK